MPKIPFILASFFILLLSKQIFATDDGLIPFYKKVVETLADDNMQGRAVSSVYEDKSAHYILKQFSSFDLAKPALQYFEFANPDNGGLQTSKNVYCYIDNKASKTILIGAHYDHIGLGETRSLSFNKKGQVHNGADDNASGVALMLGLYVSLRQWENKNYNYVFVAYSAHEIGLFGSAAFKQFSLGKFKPVTLALNFDMVGRFDPKEKVVTVYGNKTLSGYNDFFSRENAYFRISTEENDKVFETDAGIYAKASIFALSLTTGIHDDYHKVSDDVEYINYKGIELIQQMVESFLTDLTI